MVQILTPTRQNVWIGLACEQVIWRAVFRLLCTGVRVEESRGGVEQGSHGNIEYISVRVEGSRGESRGVEENQARVGKSGQRGSAWLKQGQKDSKFTQGCI